VAHHHPADDWLASYASGALDEAASVLIATHLTFCPECRKAVREFEDIGGAMLDAIDIGSSEGLMDEEMDPQVTSAPKMMNGEIDDTEYLNGSLCEIAPRPLMRYIFDQLETTDLDSLPWKMYGPGVQRAILLAGPDGAAVRLLRSRPGAEFPHHRHGSEELTVVLKGAYRDHTGRYNVGDVQCASESMRHRPIVEHGEECIALVVSDKPTIPTSLIARIFQRVVGS